MPTYFSPVNVATWQYTRNGYENPTGSGNFTYYSPTFTNSTWTSGTNFRNERQTQSNPNWKIQIAKRQNASTPYLRRVTTFVPGTYDLRVMYRNPSSPYNKIVGENRELHMAYWSINTMAVTDTALADLAVQRLKRKMSNRTQSYNLIVPLAELRELRQTVDGAATATMKVLIQLADVKKALKRSVRTLKDPKKLRKALRSAYKDASDIWLTYSFGISPMMSTILDINKSIGAYLTRYDSIDRLAGSATKAWTNSFKTYPAATCQGATKGFLSQEKFKLEYRYVAGHRFKIEAANDYSALDHFGIKPASLVSTAWELTAFSWVVDYFTTAGAFLDDTFSSTTGDNIYIVEDRRFTYECSTIAYFAKQYPTYVYYNFDVKNLEPALTKSVEFQRRVLSTYPPRVLRFRTMDEMGLNGVSKLLNLASVLSKSL